MSYLKGEFLGLLDRRVTDGDPGFEAVDLLLQRGLRLPQRLEGLRLVREGGGCVVITLWVAMSCGPSKIRLRSRRHVICYNRTPLPAEGTGTGH